MISEIERMSIQPGDQIVISDKWTENNFKDQLHKLNNILTIKKRTSEPKKNMTDIFLVEEMNIPIMSFEIVSIVKKQTINRFQLLDITKGNQDE